MKGCLITGGGCERIPCQDFHKDIPRCRYAAYAVVLNERLVEETSGLLQRKAAEEVCEKNKKAIVASFGFDEAHLKLFEEEVQRIRSGA